MVQMSREAYQTVKNYLADVEGVGVGEFVDACVLLACDHLEELEDILEIEDVDEDEGEEEEQTTCDECKAVVKESDEFCPSCGVEFEKEEETEAE